MQDGYAWYFSMFDILLFSLIVISDIISSYSFMFCSGNEALKFFKDDPSLFNMVSFYCYGV